MISASPLKIKNKSLYYFKRIKDRPSGLAAPELFFLSSTFYISKRLFNVNTQHNVNLKNCTDDLIYAPPLEDIELIIVLL